MTTSSMQLKKNEEETIDEGFSEYHSIFVMLGIEIFLSENINGISSVLPSTP